MSLNWLVMNGPVATASAWACWRFIAANAALIPSGVPTSWCMSVMPNFFSAARVCSCRCFALDQITASSPLRSSRLSSFSDGPLRCLSPTSHFKLLPLDASGLDRDKLVRATLRPTQRNDALAQFGYASRVRHARGRIAPVPEARSRRYRPATARNGSPCRH